MTLVLLALPALLIVAIVGALLNGGIRTRAGRIIGRQQTQQEFDRWMAGIEARNARRRRWLERH